MIDNKKILILYPHFPPSNLAGVHRARLFAQHLPTFGWEPTILTVHKNFYEEKLDYNLEKLLPLNLRIVKVNAFSTKKIRLFGDIGLRAFFQLYKKAKELLCTEKFDFLYIPIPSFYCALLGRMLYGKTKIKYGIDYIDPWVHTFPGSEKIFSRHWLSTKLAKFLEPIAVKKASLITGVAEGYYQPVLNRNQHLKNVITGAMPYGGEAKDHEIIKSLNIEPNLFKKNTNKLQFVYAGAMLPKAYKPLEKIFEAISENNALFETVEFHFIGTGKRTNDAESYNIKPLAEKYGLWNLIVFEYPARIPYLDVLVHLNIADAVFILGSTEPHYTPSKVYQAILSGKSLFAVLHAQSSAVKVIKDSNVGVVIDFNGENDVENIKKSFVHSFFGYKKFLHTFKKEQVNTELFNEYSAFEVTKKLASLLDETIATI
ncbi:MAG: hypothetical protein ABL929_04675 [Ferruginibacter sp.]